MREIKVDQEPSVQGTGTRSGAWSIDAEVGLLTDNAGVEARLEPRLAKLMLVLMHYEGKFVSRRQLVEMIWPNTVVTDQSLTRAVADLRKFLQSNYELPPVIETASKQGYRLLYPVPCDVHKEPRRRRFWSALRRVAVGVGTLVLFVLVLRGINY